LRVFIAFTILLLWVFAEIYLWSLFKTWFDKGWLRSALGFCWFGLPLIGLAYVMLRYPVTDFNQRLLSNLLFIWFFSKVVAVLVLAMAWLGNSVFLGVQGQSPFRAPRRDFLRTVGIVALGMPLFIGSWGLFRTASAFSIHRVRFKGKRVPEKFKGFRIVQVSDIHTGSVLMPSTLSKMVDEVIALNPDLIVFTGDLVNNMADELQPYVNVLSGLRAPFGVYSILGNHDYGDYVRWPNADEKDENLRRLISMQNTMGWKVLRNEHVVISKNGEEICLAGVENWGAKLHFKRYGKLKDALNGSPANAFTILLSHDPSHWEGEILHHVQSVDLTLSGHTHGFQFGIEIPGFKWSPVQYVYKHWAGLYQNEDRFLYVNRGTGCIGFSGRVGIPPEITLIELG
jgi:uncharacterized protein